MGFSPNDPNLNPAGGAGQPLAGAGGGTFDNPNPDTPPPNFTGATPSDLCRRPTITFVVDGSGSMCEPFGASTRWQELRNVLLAPPSSATPGLIHRLHERAQFGMLIYSGSVDLALLGQVGAGGGTCGGGLGGPDCPNLVEVQPARGNGMMLDQAFPRRELGGSTPTDKAMNVAIDNLVAAQAGADLAMNPQYIILATDGAPNDICTGGTGTETQQQVLDATARAAAAGITTFVISLAGGDAALESHLTEVARAGNPSDPMAKSFTPTTPEDLNNTLVMLLGSAFGCNIE